MAKYLAGVLSVIAVGVLLIAYGLLAPQASASMANGPQLQSMPATFLLVPASAASPGQAIGVVPFGAQTAMPANAMMPLAQPAVYRESIDDAPAPRTIEYRPSAPQRTVTQSRRTVVKAQPKKRDWKKTAVIVGGSTAGGAGLGALVGGKKGALVGAAVGGGASALYEVLKK